MKPTEMMIILQTKLASTEYVQTWGLELYSLVGVLFEKERDEAEKSVVVLGKKWREERARRPIRGLKHFKQNPLGGSYHTSDKRMLTQSMYRIEYVFVSFKS